MSQNVSIGQYWIFLYTGSTALPTLPDSAEDFLIFRKNKPIQVDNLPDSGNFLSIELYVI